MKLTPTLSSKVLDAAWYARSIRHQVLIAIISLLCLTSIATGWIAVINGRESVNVEIEASMDFAEGYLRELVKRIAAENRLADLDYLVSREVEHLRHARVYINDPGAPPKMLAASRPEIPDASPLNETPDWFEWLMMPEGGNDHSRLIVIPKGERTLILKGDPDDEIAEKWQELSALAAIALVAICVLVAIFYFVLGWILNPLVGLANGLVALEAGERSQRLKIPRVREVADITTKFNSLAASLDQTRTENGELYRQIQSVQEEERREIARELHDEAGPCLFGITANAESIDNITKRLDERDASQIKSRTEAILSITKRMKSMNRALLKRLHPISIGKVSLQALVDDLVHDLEKRHPEILFTNNTKSVSRTYGEAIDIVVYRAAQEALTNAIRHGDAKNIVVDIAEVPDTGSSGTVEGSTGSVIKLRVRDDGIGFKTGTPLGFGLSAMRERVLSSGGSLMIESVEPRGTAISVRIPVRLEQPSRAIINQLTQLAP